MGVLRNPRVLGVTSKYVVCQGTGMSARGCLSVLLEANRLCDE